MATINFGGKTMVEFTSDVPVVFDQPIKMYVTDNADFTSGSIEDVIAYFPARHSLKVIGITNSWKYCFSFQDELEPRRATWLELAKWCLDGNGLVLDKTLERIDTGVIFKVKHQNKQVDKHIYIRKWDDTEWHEPTMDYMEAK